MHLAGQPVLLGQPGAEEQRVVGAERERHARLEEGPQRHRAGLFVDAERDVGGRADLAGDLTVRQPLHQPRVLGGPHPVADPAGPEVVQAVAHRLGAGQLAAVRGGQQAALAGDGEGPVEVAGHPAPFVVGQAEAHHALVGVAHGEPGQHPGVHRRLHPVRRHQHPDPDAGGLGGLPHGVQDQLQGGDQPAQHRRVGGRVDLDLQPARAVGHLVLGGLPDQPADVLLVAQHRARGVVQPLEPEPAALVGGPQLRRGGPAERLGQPDPVPVGELQQGGGAHRPGEVQVEVGLRQTLDVTGRRLVFHSPILPYPGPEREPPPSHPSEG